MHRGRWVVVAAALALAGCDATSSIEQPPTTTASSTAATATTSSATSSSSGAPSPTTTAAPSPTSSTSSPSPRTSASPSTTERSSGAAKAAAAGPLHQVASIVDGDTIKVWIGGQRTAIRIIGLDTPESVKPGTAVACYAKQATSKMQSLAQSKQVHLVADPSQGDRDKYDRLLRYVVLPDGRDVARELIAGGFGREYTYDTAYARQASYRAAQASAQAGRKGLWGACGYAAAFDPPATTPTPRATPVAPVNPAAPPAPKGPCAIKGNISSSGERIYHRPGQQHYEQTRIDTGKGERWFCSEAEAQAAGWRAAKR